MMRRIPVGIAAIVSYCKDWTLKLSSDRVRPATKWAIVVEAECLLRKVVRQTTPSNLNLSTIGLRSSTCQSTLIRRVISCMDLNIVSMEQLSKTSISRKITIVKADRLITPSSFLKAAKGPSLYHQIRESKIINNKLWPRKSTSIRKQTR